MDTMPGVYSGHMSGQLLLNPPATYWEGTCGKYEDFFNVILPHIEFHKNFCWMRGLYTYTSPLQHCLILASLHFKVIFIIELVFIFGSSSVLRPPSFKRCVHI